MPGRRVDGSAAESRIRVFRMARSSRALRCGLPRSNCPEPGIPAQRLYPTQRLDYGPEAALGARDFLLATWARTRTWCRPWTRMATR